MPNGKRRIGDNSANINPIQDQAIRLIKEIHENVIDLDKHIKQSFLGRNKTARDNGALMSNVISNKLIQRFESWFAVVAAKANGADVHAAPVKTHKLNIVANENSERFGQYLINKKKWVDQYGDTYPTKKKFLEAIGAVDDES
jgi:hypothetical protein|tara:strand:+ start:1111 stop:1539 length:429 start_codon:yes stop_codon:yes gene_type:complete